MRKQLKRKFGSAFTIGVLAAGVMFTGSARADVVFHDTISTYFGTGNPADNWTVSTDNGVQVALRARYRNGASIYSPTDDYIVPAGACDTASPCKDLPSPSVLVSLSALALWNFDFSIDVSGALVPNLSNVAANTILTITVLDGATTVGSGSFNPFGLGDNAFHDVIGVQNSSNLGFVTGFNPNAAYEYDFTLNVVDASNASLASVDIEVLPTPEPSAVILFSTVLFGALFLIRRRQIA